MKLKLFALFAMVSLIATATIGICEGGRDKEVIPPNTAGFLSGGWHPAPECVQCHVSLLSEDTLRAKLGSCQCHGKAYTTGGKIDREEIRKKAHGVKVCIDCHVGTGIATGEITSKGIHRVHVSVDCQACHGERENVTIPEKRNCDSCHPGDAHSVHGNKTGDLCVVCHGSFGIKYKEEGYQLKEGVPVEKKREEISYPTISNILKALTELIFKFKTV